MDRFVHVVCYVTCFVVCHVVCYIMDHRKILCVISATDHVRQLVTKQLDIVVKMGIQETTYSHKDLLWQSFVALVDIILNGYCEQIDSIRYVHRVYIIQSLVLVCIN